MRKISIFLVLLCINFSVQASSDPNQYSLTVTDAAHHLAKVSVQFNNIATKSFEIKLPVWRTGKYQILDLAKNIRHFQVFDAQGEPLTWHKQDKNTWRVFINTPGTINVNYQVYANELRSRVSHIDETHAFLDASGVFVYSESQRDKPLTIQLNVPGGWRSVSGMDSIGEHQFKASNYDQFVDSPIESGIHHYDSLQVDEQKYEIVIWGDGNFDMQRLKRDIKKLHIEAKKLWKNFPFKRYVYMFHAGDHLRGATEHVNSTIIQLDRFGFAPDKNYFKIIATTAHEFVHTWNVKSYRPAGISPYDYSTENYSDLFWMAEGTTSYYDNLLALRSGIFDLEKYLENIAKDIDTFNKKPGKEVMALSESSFDTWMSNDGNRRHNTTVSIYLKGSLVSWLLDKKIREDSTDKYSLDDLHRLLFEYYANKKEGYTSNDVKRILKQLTDTDFSQFWKDYVEGTKAINFEELLAFYALKIKAKDDKIDKEQVSSVNASFKNNNGLAEISRIDSNGSAWKAGLANGDSIVAIAGIQVTHQSIKERIENLSPDQGYLTHYFSQGLLKNTTLYPVEAKPEKITIELDSSASKKTKKRFNQWSHLNYKDQLSGE